MYGLTVPILYDLSKTWTSALHCVFYMPISPGQVVRLNVQILCMDYQSQFCMILVRHGLVVSVVLFFMSIWTGGPSDISSTVFSK